MAVRIELSSWASGLIGQSGGWLGRQADRWGRAVGRWATAVATPKVVDQSPFALPASGGERLKPLRLTERLARPVPALPLDIFRAAAGLLSAGYFLWLLSEAESLSNPDGLIDHELSREIFWYTKMSLIPPGMGLNGFRALYLLATAGSLLVAAGYRPRQISALLFLVAVSAYRWNFMVVNIEDGLMHLLLFWLALLPTGRTLTLESWLKEGPAALPRWRDTWVPGGTVRGWLGNVGLVYLVAGLWKWTSPLWRQGLALYAAVKTPVSRAPNFWRREHLPALVAGNYFSLVVEPLLPLMLALPTGHPLKWTLAACAAAFHLGIVLTLKVPFANIALIAALPLFLREELMGLLNQDLSKIMQIKNENSASTLRQAQDKFCVIFDALLPAGAIWRDENKPPSELAKAPLDTAAKIGFSLLTVISLAMLFEARHPEWRKAAFQADGRLYRAAERVGLNPNWGSNQNPFYAILWALGFAQSYRLVDWIDGRNFYISYEAEERLADGRSRSIDPEIILPPTLRGALLKSYLHNQPWRRMKPNDLAAIRQSLLARFAARYFRQFPHSGPVTIYALVQRTTADNLDLNQPVREKFMDLTGVNTDRKEYG